MNKSEIYKGYQETQSSNVSGGYFIVLLLIVGVIVIGGAFYLPILVGPIATIGIFLGVPCILIWNYSATQAKQKRELFDQADIHTHDDNCYTCGDENAFGKQPAWGPKDLEQYKCRHASGQMYFRE